jgi:hypothetical protein
MNSHELHESWWTRKMLGISVDVNSITDDARCQSESIVMHVDYLFT